MKEKIKLIVLVFTMCMISLMFFLFVKRIYRTYQYNSNSYYKYYISKTKNDSETGVITEKDNFATVIDHTTKLSDQRIKNKDTAIRLIKSESSKQAERCNNNNIKKVENEIEVITGIYGVNLCELDVEEAENIEIALEYVYDNYPILKNYLTNITLVNDGGLDSYIAAFKPAFTFATSNTQDRFPFVIKMQVFLNASYFLNNQYFDLVVETSRNNHHFPNNTTKTSLVVHEFGHVLTYVLALKEINLNTLLLKSRDFKNYSDILKTYTESSFSKKIVFEAFDNIKKEKELTLEEFQENISGYAKTTDEYGQPLYNETIAEAFHDYYLNKDHAQKESLEIINILNKYIEEVS